MTAATAPTNAWNDTPGWTEAHEALLEEPTYLRMSTIDQMLATFMLRSKVRAEAMGLPPPDHSRIELLLPLKTDEQLVRDEAGIPDGGMDAADLLNKVIAPLVSAVDGILPEGLGVLAAPPKAGKSVLAYQLAVELTLGHAVLGRKVAHRPVLYYALEDGERRSKDRVAAALGRRPLARGLTLMWEAPRLGSGLEQEVTKYLSVNPLGVVIIDVLSKVRPATSTHKSLNAYDEDYSTLEGLHKVAKRHPGSVILLITHDRKAGAEDWMTRITGTRGVSGVADFTIFIDRARGLPVGTIHVTGRDIPDESIGVRFTGAGWEPADVAALIGTASETRQAIYDYVAKAGPVWQKAIAEVTVLSETVVYNRVRDMVRDGQLVAMPDGYVAAPVDPTTGRWTSSS